MPTTDSSHRLYPITTSSSTVFWIGLGLNLNMFGFGLGFYWCSKFQQPNGFGYVTSHLCYPKENSTIKWLSFSLGCLVKFPSM